MIMTSIADLARELGAQAYEVRAFWPDAMNLADSDTDELPADVVAAFREAWTVAPEAARFDD